MGAFLIFLNFAVNVFSVADGKIFPPAPYSFVSLLTH